MPPIPSRLTRRKFIQLAAACWGGALVAPLRLDKLHPPPAGEKPPHPAWLPGLPETELPPNPLLQKLGLSTQDRVVLLQVDGLGLCHANLEAFSELAEAFPVISGSLAVPGAWFPLAAHYARTHPAACLGVSLTLTSPFHGMRWRALSTIEPASGLVDAAGYLPQTPPSLTTTAITEAISAELEAQIRRAQTMGVRPTHLDGYQGVLYNPKLLKAGLKIAELYKVPAALLRPSREAWSAVPGLQIDLAPELQALTQPLEEQGYPLLDSLLVTRWLPVENRGKAIQQTIANLKPGVHLVKITPAKDTPELRAMTPGWENWVADYSAWTDPALRSFINNARIDLIGWDRIQEVVLARSA